MRLKIKRKLRTKKQGAIADGIIFKNVKTASAYDDLKLKYEMGILQAWEMEVPLKIYAGPNLVCETVATFFYQIDGIKVLRFMNLDNTRKNLLQSALKNEYLIEVFPGDCDMIARKIEILKRRKK